MFDTVNPKLKQLLNNTRLTLAELVDGAQEGIVVLDNYGDVIYTNVPMSEILKILHEELHSKRFQDFIHVEDKCKFIPDLLNHNVSIKRKYEIRLIDSNGDIVWGMVSVTSLFDKSNNFIGVLCLVHVINEVKQLEQTMRELVSILEYSKDWYIVFKVINDTATIYYKNGSCKYTLDEISNSEDGILNLVLQVYNTKVPIIGSNLITKFDNENIVLDIQVYQTNGFIVFCGRDLRPAMYKIREEAARISTMIDALINT